MSEAEPHIIYLCQSAQIVVQPEAKAVEIRFVTSRGTVIAMVVTGAVFEHIHRKSGTVLDEMPEIAGWHGEPPQ